MEKMISYYDLMLLVKAKKQPNKVLVLVDKDRELLFEFNSKYNTYYVTPTTVSETFYKEYDSYLDLNITEDRFFEKSIKYVEPYLFNIGEYVSYYDLMTSIKFNTQPYRVRIHINNLQHDYIFDRIDSSEPKKYIVLEDDGSLPSWDFNLSHQVSDNNWFEKNIEVIEAGNSLIRIVEGGCGSSYFNIFPIKVKNVDDDTDATDNVEEMWDDAIAIEEENVNSFLYPVLKKYFNSDLLENKNRSDAKDEFEWYLTNNFYTYDNIEEMIKELKEIMTLLKNDYDNPKLDFIKENYSWVLYLDSRVDSRNIPENSKCNELVKPYVDEIINFYKRFIDYLEDMMINGKKNGFELITFIGP